MLRRRRDKKAAAAAAGQPGMKGQQQETDKFSHLPPEEAEILARQIRPKQVKIKLRTLYRYASRGTIALLLLANIGAIAGGAGLPFMAVIFGSISGSFKDFFEGKIDSDDLKSTVSSHVLYFVYLAAAEFVAVYISVVGNMTVGRTVSDQIRERYLEACLRQNIGFHDTLGAGVITTRITADMNVIQDGISDKIGLTIAALATFVAALAIAFYEYWKLALILSSSVVAMLLIMTICAKLRIGWMKKAMYCFAMSGNIAEESFSGIRTSVAYGMQEPLAQKYNIWLGAGEKSAYKAKTMIGVMMGGFFFVINMIYGLAFWQGNRFMIAGDVPMQGVMTTVMSILNAALAVGNVSSQLQAVVTALAVAARIFEVIDRESPMDPIATGGQILDRLDHAVEIRFEHIKHIYPSRPDTTVLHDFSLVCPAGQKTALVGGSGSGKSTCIGLIERFYEPVEGKVFFDGHEVKDLALSSLRQQISLVSQEPTLFSSTIFENIRYGLIGSRFEDADEAFQRQLVIDAAKMANAHGFIMQLEDEYQTNVGDRGSLLSGGQRQRIAIARAIVRDPKVLLLDEATSALDAESERIVQNALEVASHGRTTIIIAHRLSTIRDADNIVVMNKGLIVENGNHESLMSQHGVYWSLVENQRMAPAELKPPSALTSRKSKRLSYFAFADQVNHFEKHVDDAFSVRDSVYSNTDSLGPLYTGSKKMGDEEDQVPILYEEPPPKKYGTWTLIKMIGGFNKQDWPWMLFGLFWSIIAGCAQPAQSAMFGLSVNNMSQWPFFQTDSYTTSRADYLASMYIILAFIQILAFSLQSGSFSLCSERLIHRARLIAFRTLLRQDIAYFDLDKNTAGALTSFLGVEASAIAGLSGPTLGSVCMLTATLVGCIALSTVVGWKLALVAASTIPLLLACGFLRVWALARYEKKAKAGYKESASFACEATNAVRTIAALGRERHVVEQYRVSLHGIKSKDLLTVYTSSGLYAASQAIVFGVMALGFWWGGNLMADNQLTMAQFFICFPTIVFGAQSAGNIFSYAPDIGKAQEAARDLKVLLDRKPPIDTWSREGRHITKIETKGTIRFQNVQFVYPTRPDNLILRGLNLNILPGQYVAFVGGSGCGKSTAISLLQRFYHANGGRITLDGHDITKLNLNSYRSVVALVSQEPNIYSGTIRDNIIFGMDPAKTTQADVERAAHEANLYEFVMSLPEGFQTKIGGKGSTLSGGQKQRIAIARALIRQPKVLLLDEATSALDSESEKQVQAALDIAAKGRTTIAIAHRLSTVKNADTIYYFENGQVAESGSHDYLMAHGKKYPELVRQQSNGH